MTEEEREQIGRDSRNARRLLDDELFMSALKSVRDEALESLISADPTTGTALIRAQETVKVCDRLVGELTSKMDLATIAARPKPA
jgi:hypothetical protein